MDCTTWSHLWNGGLPLMRSGLELTEVPAVQQKRMVAFLNQSEVHTTTFLQNPGPNTEFVTHALLLSLLAKIKCAFVTHK
uniref:Uncharacterized protein n=1 Tax=Suricata suricatta TaxID=37032 RepID=A0A673U452_SURSU